MLFSFSEASLGDLDEDGLPLTADHDEDLPRSQRKKLAEHLAKKAKPYTAYVESNS